MSGCVVTPSTPITPADKKRATDMLAKAKVQLVVGHPFWAQIVFNRKINIDDNVKTAHVNPRGSITVGTRFILSLNVQQLVFLLAHEAMHYAMLHFLRRGHRDPFMWNVAGDAVINDLLTEGSVGEKIPGGVDMPGSKDKTAEKIYEELQQQQEDGGQQGPYVPGEGFNDLDESGGGNQLTESEKREIEQQVRVEMAQAAQVAKQQGKLPASLQRIVDEIVNPLTPWHQLLERYMTGFINADYSWRRPKKSMLSAGWYLPASDRIPQMGPVVVAVDTSGSVGPKELQHFLGHMNRILETCRPEVMYVVPCDAQTYEHSEISVDDLPITAEMASEKGMARGGGGTAFEPVFEWVREQGIEPEVLVYLTDMYGSFPPEAAPYETIWLSISDVTEAPFGMVIPYRMDEQ